MPDSQPPIQGPASQRERDLDALLSGAAGYPTVVLGPVAGVLAALRAAPAPDELDGEAAARAAFRLFMLPEAARLADACGPLPQVPAQFHQVAVAGEGRPDGPGPTVVLPRTAPGGPRHARPRHARPRPRLPWPGRWQVMAAACGAAAAVIVGVAALAGAFSGPSGQQGRSGPRSSPQSSSTSSQRATSSVLGTATARPTPRPSGPVGEPGSAVPSVHGLLHAPEPPANRSAENAVVQQLEQAGRRAVADHRLLRQAAWRRGAGNGFQGGAGDPGAGNQPGEGGHGEHGTAAVWPDGIGLPCPAPGPCPAGPVRAGRTAR